MLREHKKFILQGHRVLDIFLTAFAFVGAYFLKKYIIPEPFRGLITGPNYYIVLLLIIIIWFIVFDGFKIYKSYRRQSLSKILFDMVKAVCAAMLVLMLILYVLKITDVSRIMMGIFFILDITLLGLSKLTAYRVLILFRRRGFNFQNVLIVGCRERAKDVIRNIGDRIGAGFRVVGCVDLDDCHVGATVENGCKVIGSLSEMKDILSREVVDELIIAMPLKLINNAGRYIATAEDMGVTVRIIPDWQLHQLKYNPEKAHVQFDEFFGIPTMSLETTPPDKGALIIKTAFDYLVAGLLFILFLPVMLFAAVAIKIASPGGPVLYRQERLGLNGRRFKVYKFRTMVPAAERMQEALIEKNEADGPVFKIRKDPRIIPWIGHFLRKTSLDELPQLINVLRGEMSLVGPRPPIPSEVDRYEIWHRRRLSMKPGMACLWQVCPRRNEVLFADWMKMDLEYIDNWSLWLDFKILFKTVLIVLTGSGR